VKLILADIGVCRQLCAKIIAARDDIEDTGGKNVA